MESDRISRARWSALHNWTLLELGDPASLLEERQHGVEIGRGQETALVSSVAFPAGERLVTGALKPFDDALGVRNDGISAHELEDSQSVNREVIGDVNGGSDRR